MPILIILLWCVVLFNKDIYTNNRCCSI